MSEEKEEKAEGEEAPKKGGGGGKGSVVAMVLVVILASAGSAAAAIFGPPGYASYMKQKAQKEKHKAEEEEEEEGEGHGESAQTIKLDAVIVDIRDPKGEAHHLRVGMALELKKKLKEEEEAIAFGPRARDTTIEYCRALAYDEVTNPKKFDVIRKELSERVIKAVGKKHVKRVLFTDFVVQ